MAPEQTAPRLLRVLCLHGYTQSADAFRVRSGALRKGLKGSCDFTFVDAPHVATADFVGDAEGAGSPQLAWWNAAADEAQGTRPSQSKTYVGWVESMRYLDSVIQDKGPFDGILAFSQGSAIGAVLLASLYARGHAALPAFAILVSGFVPRDDQASEVLRTNSPVPVATLHVCGESDALVSPQLTEALSTCFAAATIFRHEGGHAIPGNSLFRNTVKSFIAPHFAAVQCGVRAEAASSTRLEAAEAAAPAAAVESPAQRARQPEPQSEC